MNERPCKGEEKKMVIEYSKTYVSSKVIFKKITHILSTLVIMGLLFTPCLEAKKPKHENKDQTYEEDIREDKIVKQKQESKMKNQIEEEPELIWQKDFGTKILRFKLHKEIDATDFPILAVETEDNLIIFDKKGNERIKRSLPKNKVIIGGKEVIFRGYVVVSDNGEYVLEGKGIPESSYDLKYRTIEGKTLWEKKKFYGVPVVSPDGSVVVLLGVEGGKNKKGVVEFYDRSGKLLKQHSMDLSSIVGMPNYALSFSEDGNYFILRLEQWIEEKNGKRAMYPIILFDKRGNPLWEKNIEVTPGKSSINELLISPFGNYISYSSDKYIYMIDREGKLLWRSEFHNLLAFSKNEKLLLMKAEDFLVVDGPSGNRIVCFNLGLVRIPFMNSPVLSQDGRAVAIVAASRNIGEKDNFYILKLFGKEAQIIFEGDYPFNFIRKSQFSTDSKQLCFVGQKGSKLSVYKLIFSNKK